VSEEHPFFRESDHQQSIPEAILSLGVGQVSQPTQKTQPFRRRAEFFSPISKARRQKRTAQQQDLGLTDAAGLSSAAQKYDSTIVNDLRGDADAWRSLPNPADWGVSPATALLLTFWRDPDSFTSVRPFFCQVEAVESLIWLTEVASNRETTRRK